MASLNRKIHIDITKNSDGAEIKDNVFTRGTSSIISDYNDINDFLFDIEEYATYKITVEGKNDTTKVFIQNYNSMSNEDKEIEITEPYIIEAQSFVPGPAYLVIDDGTVRHIRYFNVIGPKFIDGEGLSKIRSVIEEISPGMSLEFKSKIENLVVGDFLNNSNKLKLATLVSRSKKISVCANQIIGLPIELLNKGLKATSDIKKQNAKSINKNLKSPKDNTYYNVITKRTIDVSENVALFDILLQIKKYCQTLNNIVDMEIANCEATLAISNKNKKKNEKYYESIIKDTSDRKKVLEENIKNLFSISNSCSQVINELGLFSLRSSSRAITQRFLKNSSYRYLFELNNLLSSENVSFLLNGNNEVENVYFKSSPVLFELYTYSIIKHMILNEGYQKIQSSESGATFTSAFIKNYNRIEVRYNVDSLRLYDALIENEGLISMKRDIKEKEGSHTTPDISIISFDKNNKVVAASIIEVKCRQFANIYDEDDKKNTLAHEVKEQLYDYYNFKYKKSDEKIDANFNIDNVICVYPYQKSAEQFKDESLLDIYYVGLNISKNFAKTKAYEFMREKLSKHFS